MITAHIDNDKKEGLAAERKGCIQVEFGVTLGMYPVLLRRDETQKFSGMIKRLDDDGVTAIGTYNSAFIGGDNFVRGTLTEALHAIWSRRQKCSGGAQ